LLIFVKINNDNFTLLYAFIINNKITINDAITIAYIVQINKID